MSDTDGTEDTATPRIRPVVGGRTAARERAVHLLYEASMTERSGSEVLAEQVVAADRYAEDLVAGVEQSSAELDALIGDLAPAGWTLARMASLDLCVLRVACWELLHSPDVPTGVILAEAVALAESYGTDDSPRFVNGLLAAAAARVRPGAGSDQESSR
ncbi:MAG: transcription antitermination factor NusB [Microthrixaceae bacterium]